MKPKLREIVITRRKGTVPRRAIRAAVLKVMAEREAREQGAGRRKPARTTGN